MAKEKRQRQKEGRQLRLEEQRAQEKRSQRMRQIRAVVLVVVAILGVALIISLLGGNGDDTPVATDGTETTDGTEATDDAGEEPEAPAAADPDDYSEPEIAAEVLDRDPPEPEGAPEDIDPDAVEVTTVIEGEGREIEAGDTVTVHYAGVLSDGTPFDDSWSRGDPFVTTIPGAVIDGWNEGLIGARIGERRRLEIGYEKAYGEAGRDPIPESAPLAFEIDVVDAVPAGD
jgi:peptidylprolyl isomerase